MKPSERIKEIASMGSQPPWENCSIPTQIDCILQYLDELAEKKPEHISPNVYRLNSRAGRR